MIKLRFDYKSVKRISIVITVVLQHIILNGKDGEIFLSGITKLFNDIAQILKSLITLINNVNGEG